MEALVAIGTCQWQSWSCSSLLQAHTCKEEQASCQGPECRSLTIRKLARCCNFYLRRQSPGPVSSKSRPEARPCVDSACGFLLPQCLVGCHVRYANRICRATNLSTISRSCCSSSPMHGTTREGSRSACSGQSPGLTASLLHRSPLPRC